MTYFATTRSITIDWRLSAVAALLWTLALGCDGASTPKKPAASLEAAAGAGGSPAILATSGGTEAAVAGQPAPSSGADSGGVAMGSQAGAGSSPGAEERTADSSPQPSAAGSGADAPLKAAEPDYREVIASDWELAPGDEAYLCLRKTAGADLYINQFRTILPAGTHHAGLYVSPTSDKADGTVECGLLETGDRMIVGGGPGSGPLSWPPGVALRIDSGDELLLQLHLFNPSDSPLRGRSSVQGVMLPEDAVKVEADVLVAQLLTLVIPSGQTRTRGRCTFDRAQTLVGFGAHMHQTGRHVKVVLHRSGSGGQVLRDGDYDFNEQRRYPLDTIEVAAGDYIDYECTYQNATDRTIYWGESSLDEMCLVNFYRFPAGGPTLCLL